MKIFILCVLATVACTAYGAKLVPLKDSPIDECDKEKCPKDCIAKGFKGGICIGTYCYCWNDDSPLAEATGELTFDKTETQIDECDKEECPKYCISKGWKGGICIGTYCYCWNDDSPLANATSAATFEKFESEIDECDKEKCPKDCIAKGFKGGICIGTYCYCWNDDSPLAEAAGEVTFDKVESEIDECDKEKCPKDCIAKGFKGGICIGTYCYCWNDDSPLAEESEEIRVEKLETKNPENACDNITCVRSCLALGWRGGFCQGGQCWCWT